MKKQQGFTLVEIAIVMVIIGLLLGGVLKGQEIITNARVKNVENDFNGVTAAIYSYQDRYRAIPGDDSKVGNRWKRFNEDTSSSFVFPISLIVSSPRKPNINSNFPKLLLNVEYAA